MKTEMTKSLVASWLKHEYGCQVVQQNWKASSLWDSCVEPKGIEKIFKRLRKKLADEDLEFTTKKMKSSQMFLQGEIDCIGICLKLDDNFKLVVEKIYAVQVAFHERGLNYGEVEETCKRVRKKFIQTALAIYKYFGVKNDIEVIFASPKTMLGHLQKLKQTTRDIKNVFDDLGFEYEFKLYCNQDFRSLVFEPIQKNMVKMSDTSELFLKSLKLINILNQTNDKKEITTLNIGGAWLSQETRLKIEVTAKNIFEELSKSDILEESEIKNLCLESYTKRTFGLPYPVLIEFNGNENIAFVNGKRRYYSETYVFHEKQYLLCNHWFESRRGLLEKWYQRRRPVKTVKQIWESL